MPRKIQKTEAQWREQLSPIEYQVTRERGTERAFTGRYWDCVEPGQYRCVCCGAVLFDSDNKFDAGCGWPSFDRPAVADHIENVSDTSHGMRRTEVLCQPCGAHLGHVFNDGPTDTGLRYCINSAAVTLAPHDDTPA